MSVFFILFTVVFAYYIFRVIIEPVYVMIYNRPVYVHLYLVCKKLPAGLTPILEKEFAFYRNLSLRKKRYFEHRVERFINHYKFIPQEGLDITDEMKVKIAATSVMLTFGMQKYIYKVFNAVILFPDIFPSKIDGIYHKGEFNPAARTITFSWKHFEEGIKYDSDNLNLGLHEFAHALHFDSLSKKRPGSSAIIYKDGFNKILKYIESPANREKLISENYFRGYAYTNQYEFVAVLLEYFFETPQLFRQKLPELYTIVKRMINFTE